MRRVLEQHPALAGVNYKQVTDAARKLGTRVVAVSGENPSVNQAYLASHGITSTTCYLRASVAQQLKPGNPSLCFSMTFLSLTAMSWPLNPGT